MERRPVLLACEDEERIVELLRALTEPLGVDLVAARDGATALAQLAARRPALMTLDLVLPNLDGFARARAHPPAARSRRHADRRHLRDCRRGHGQARLRARRRRLRGQAVQRRPARRQAQGVLEDAAARRRGARAPGVPRGRRRPLVVGAHRRRRRAASSSRPTRRRATSCRARPSRSSGAPSPRRCPAPSRSSSSRATRRSGA